MKPARITFLALFTIGILGGVGGAWEESKGVAYLGGSQFQETLNRLFSPAGFIDYFVVPTLFAVYVSLIVAGYQRFVKPKVAGKSKVLFVILTILTGIIGQFVLIFIFAGII